MIIATNKIGSLKAIFIREVKMFSNRRMFLFCMIIAPIACLLFFTSLMHSGLPTELPTGLVNEDDTHITRILARTLDSFEATNIVAHYPNFTSAREAMQRGEIYAIFYIPKGTTQLALSNKQPKISFYTNEAYYVPGTLLMKDLRTASELTGLALTRESLYAHGLTERQALAVIQPIAVESHPINNSYLDYSVYLNNILLPGILILLIMLTTAYTIGLEWKQNKQKEWYRLSGYSSTIALWGKLLPQSILFTVIIIFYDVFLYKFLMFPCHSGILSMMALGVLTVLASQSFAVFLLGVFAGQMRLSMCLCALWGILSFSLAGFTYPVTAMHPVFKALAWLFPLRHYYLIYVNQALDGYPLVNVFSSVASLLIFLLLPFLVLPRYRAAFLKYKYKP